MKKRVYIAHTGGTIGMQPSSSGYTPAQGFLAKQMARMPELSNPAMPAYHVNDYDPLVDSSNMSPHHWQKIALDIQQNYDQYDGFVVLHGTDTMAYTASALPFMLQGLGKPVILTGGQIPLCEIRNDSRENLITAMLIAAQHAIAEVCLFFGNKLLRGNRAVKVNANGFDAFDSPNMPPLGQAGTGINIRWSDVLAPPLSQKLEVQPLSETRVAVLRLFPGIDAHIVRNILAPPTKGIILETFGMGNGPSENQGLLDLLKDAVDRGVIIVNCTQCLQGTVRMAAYATGSALADRGVISGLDMTTEAALAKLIYLLSLGLSGKEVKEQMQTELKGELTPPDK